MNFERKPLYRPFGKDYRAMRAAFHNILLEATKLASESTGCSGASFVTSSIGIWAQELSEVDPKNTIRFLTALATLVDPTKNDAQKRMAEEKRRKAFEALMLSVQIDIETEGATKQ